MPGGPAGDLLLDARQRATRDAVETTDVDRNWFRGNADLVAGRLQRDTRSVAAALHDRTRGPFVGARRGTYAFWSAPLDRGGRRRFTGVRAGEVDYNHCAGPLL